MLWCLRRLLAGVAATGAALPLFAAEVHVIERAEYGGTVETLRDQTLYTLNNYVTQSAPILGGYIFTHWTTSAAEGFQERDVFGRAFDAAPFTLYGEMTLTAHYVGSDVDSDGDGVPDGYELYWYGDLSKNAASDTDGDGMTFAEEIAAGTNPLFADRSLSGVVSGESTECLYNPNGYHSYVMRSEPEGELLTTTIGYAKPGETVTTPKMDRLGSFFAYWTRDGVRVADILGRAADEAKFTMPNADVELVAVAEYDNMRRAALYWYGSATATDSDTDGDGMTLAEEVAAGTNPLFADRSLSGVVSGESEVWQYNPNNYHEYVFRSEPEGALFETASAMATPGTQLETPAMDRKTSFFAYWTRNGERVADALGRAKDQVPFVMPQEDVEFVAWEIDDDYERAKMYWYGDSSVRVESDTDGDGMTLAEEIAAGTNPLFPDRSLSGITSDASDEVEMNLQPYEKVRGAIVDNAYTEMFGTEVFGNGGAVWPVVADLNGDGLWDLVVCLENGAQVFLNVGSAGNPEFVGGDAALAANADLEMNSVAKLDDMTLDVSPPDDALSATTNGVALLVSDSEGRIWYYAGNGEQVTGNSFTLQHKVWGGSFAGFAQGLRLAAVDWEDDGDLDCLAGTADGKLMLLRDPKVGRPTNLKALAGVDNILLTWDPNAQSRIRGYRVYRDDIRIAQPQLPTHRDFPGEGGAFDYKVSSVSRFYTAGNSTPTETESMPTEAVRAELGQVKFFWNDVAVKCGEKAEVMLSIENSMNYNATGQSQTVVYAPEYLTPVKVAKTGLTENCELEYEVVNDGEWQITITGSLPAGGGKFLTLVFETVKDGTTKVGGDEGATVSIAAADTPIVPYRLGDVDGDGDVDIEDLRLLAKLKSAAGRKPTASQLKAGDFNGNGKLDNADYQELRKQLKQKGVL